MGNLPVQKEPKFTKEIPAVTKEDMITAELENQIKGALLNNDVFLKQAIEKLVKEVITSKGGTIKEGANLTLEGGMLYMQRPSIQESGAYARGVTFLDENAKIVGGIGFHGYRNTDKPSHAYFGIETEAPWGRDQGLTIDENKIQWKNNEILTTENGQGKFKTIIDLRDTSVYNENTWYPIYKQGNIPLAHWVTIEASASLYDGDVPSWATHTSGFGAHFMVMELGSGTNAAKATGIIFDDSCIHTVNEIKPITYKQFWRSSTACVFLRGGGKYNLYSSKKIDWEIHTDSKTINEETINPLTSYQAPVLISKAGDVAKADRATSAKLLEVLNSNEINFKNLPASGALWFNHKDVSGTMGEHQAIDYRFGDGHGNTVQTAITTGKIIAGNANTAAGVNVSAFGYNNDITGHYSVVIGAANRNRANYTLTAGYQLFNNTGAGTVLGQFNKETAAAASFLVIGNGSQESTRSNCFGVDTRGNVRATGTFNASTAADYAEYFEWVDGNLENQDRIGYFVTMDNNKIRIADAEDTYILGIVSAKPAVLGNADCDSWNGMYLRDELGRDILEPKPKITFVEIKEEIEREVADIDPETKEMIGTKIIKEMVVTGIVPQEATDENGNLIYEGTRQKLNPAYNPNQEYISRADRPEWAAVGMLGVLAVYDDNTCKANGFCKVAAGGIATVADGEYTLAEGKIIKGYRVIERVTNNIIKVVFR